MQSIEVAVDQLPGLSGEGIVWDFEKYLWSAEEVSMILFILCKIVFLVLRQ